MPVVNCESKPDLVTSLLYFWVVLFYLEEKEISESN